jgi:glycosyltransferase involved in cell wall biosynthesis
MKVLHVNYSDKGGAAIALLRLHDALCSAGIDSQCLFFRATSDAHNSFCSSVATKKINGLQNKIMSLICGPSDPVIRSVNLFHTGLGDYLNGCDADVIHLHWINAESISVRELAKIKKPIVWTMHDMWPFCGAEHYTTSTRFIDGYDESSYRSTSKELRRPFDLDRWVWEKKNRYWKGLDLHPVAVSQWLGGLAAESKLLKKRDISVIHNTLDMGVFREMDKEQARKRLGLPLGKKIILFGSSGNRLERKGFDLLKAALGILSQQMGDDLAMAVFGESLDGDIAGIPTRWFGNIKEAERLAMLYNACDVMCVPSRLESFGQTASEAQACGVPVVAFNTTGLQDIVEHGVGGYLASPYDCNDFAHGLRVVLEAGDAVYRKMCVSASNKARATFSPNLIAAKYIDLYSDLKNMTSRSV